METKLASAGSLEGILECIKKFWIREDVELIQDSQNKLSYAVKLAKTIKPSAFVRKRGRRFYFVTDF